MRAIILGGLIVFALAAVGGYVFGQTRPTAEITARELTADEGVVTPTSTTAPSATVAAAMPTSTAVPSATPAPAPTAVPIRNTVTPQAVPTQVGLACNKHGQIAWQNDNVNPSYEASPVGGMNEPCWVVLQTWQDNPQVRYLVGIRPFSVAWLQGHKGGTGWFFNGSDADVRANLDTQGGELNARDGSETTIVLILSDDAQKPEAKRLILKTAVGAQFDAGKKITAITQMCVGPAILEYGEPGTGTPVVRKLNVGEQSPKFTGGCFNVFANQAALDARWPSHKAEFLVKYPGGKVIEGGSVAPSTSSTTSSSAASPASASGNGVCTQNGSSFIATGPAIVEDASGPTLARVFPGASYGPFQGGCFAVASSDLQDPNWSRHKTVFLGKFPSAIVKDVGSLSSTSAVPASATSGDVCMGPAILEFGPPKTVVKVNSGSSSPKNRGGCFPFSSQSDLDARWPSHKAEFLAKNPGGQTIE